MSCRLRADSPVVFVHSLLLLVTSEFQAAGPESQPGAAGAMAQGLLRDTTAASVLGMGTQRGSRITMELGRKVGGQK